MDVHLKLLARFAMTLHRPLSPASQASYVFTYYGREYTLMTPLRADTTLSGIWLSICTSAVPSHVKLRSCWKPAGHEHVYIPGTLMHSACACVWQWLFISLEHSFSSSEQTGKTNNQECQIPDLQTPEWRQICWTLDVTKTLPVTILGRHEP